MLTIWNSIGIDVDNGLKLLTFASKLLTKKLKLSDSLILL